MKLFPYIDILIEESFEWDEDKNRYNIIKHGVSFEIAQLVFSDPDRIIYIDIDHSTTNEKRYYCIGKVDKQICTVRFTYRFGKIRIFGAGFWRKETKIYEKRRKQ